MAAQSGLGFSGIVAIQIPDDGAIGEVLTKITTDNYDYDWVAGGGGGGQVDSVVGGVNISVNAADPVNPIVNLDAALLGVSVNGVTLSAVGVVTNFLNETGVYSVPPLDTVAADLLYLRLDTANDPLTGDLSTLSVVPTVDQDAGRTYGADNLRPLSVHGRLGIFVGSSFGTGSGGPNNAAGTRSFGSDPTGIMGGNQIQGGAGTATHYLRGGAFKGVACIGNAASGAAGSALLSNRSGGSSLFGSAYSYGAGNATVEATAFGNFTSAYSYASANNHLWSNRGSGAFLAGYSQGSGIVTAEVTGLGAFGVWRPVSSNATAIALCQSNGAGSFSQGFTQSTRAGFTTGIQATGEGSFAQGTSRSGILVSANPVIQATGIGAFAQGRANNGIIRASANGAFAQGSASGNNTILASGAGSFAHGDAAGGNITASAVNSAQFGVGVNALADSLQVGNGGLRFKGTAGAPGVIQDGDFWMVGTDVNFRSNGVTVGPFNQPSVTGSRAANPALASLLTQLAALNIVVDNTVV